MFVFTYVHRLLSFADRVQFVYHPLGGHYRLHIKQWGKSTTSLCQALQWHCRLLTIKIWSPWIKKLSYQVWFCHNFIKFWSVFSDINIVFRGSAGLYQDGGLYNDGHKPRRPQQWKREKLRPNAQLSSFNIIGKISPSWSSWFVAVIVEPRFGPPAIHGDGKLCYCYYYSLWQWRLQNSSSSSSPPPSSSASSSVSIGDGGAGGNLPPKFGEIFFGQMSCTFAFVVLKMWSRMLW